MNNAILVSKTNGDAELGIREGVPHAFEVFALRHPYISLHDASNATFKLGIREIRDPETQQPAGLFRIVQMNNGGDPDVARPGISMTMQGQVGIGTDDPRERLDVAGNLILDGELLLPGLKGGEMGLRTLLAAMHAELQSQRERIALLEARLAESK